jgi:hypothetical protein
VSTDEGQRFAKDNGFESIEVVKPLAGFIVKDNGEKYMIYPFVQGEAWSRLDPNVGFQDSAPVQGLIDLLRKNGVMPTDLVGRQIMIDGNKMLLTDMEVYHPISKDEG